MWGRLFLISVSGFWALSGFGQLKEQVHFEDDDRFEKVELNIAIKTSAFCIKATHHPDVVRVYSNADMRVYSRSLESKIVKKTCFIDLSLQQHERTGVGQNISQRVFGNEGYRINDLWTIFLTETKPYNLSMNCGLGDAKIDLSELLINRLKVRTGSANVTTFYGSGTESKVAMDTFLVQVDVGFITARQLNLARPKTVIAEVGFGGILLDFGGTVPASGIHVISSVGTGSLAIILPEHETPVKVHINNSWLSDLDVPQSLQQISKNTFANSAYLDKKPNPLIFDIDVSMGMVTFR